MIQNIFVARVAQWLQWQCKDLMNLSLRVRIPPWDDGAGVTGREVTPVEYLPRGHFSK
jgi:hypothetical protein